MSETRPPDWFARVLAVLALVLSSLSLGLNYLNYRWQTKESLEERILVRLGYSRNIKRIDLGEIQYAREGDVGVEVVNIGMHPIYIKTVNLEHRRRIFTFYERNPLTTTPQHMDALEPGEAKNYKLRWDFSENPLEEWINSDLEREDLWIDVQTTKKDLRQHSAFSWAFETLPGLSCFHGLPEHGGIILKPGQSQTCSLIF